VEVSKSDAAYNRRVGLFGVPCAGCVRQVQIDAHACSGCGRVVTAEERAAEHARRVRRARWWMGALAIIFAGNGILGLAAARGGYPDVSLSGARADLGLAPAFGVFWMAARRAPVAALAASIALLLGVWIVVGVIDRSTLLDGYVIRLAAFVIFAAGLRAALAARRAPEAR
jgi:hypothetical protein